MMRVAVLGSQKYRDLERVHAFMETLPVGTVVISGGVPGPDTIAETCARRRGLEFVRVTANGRDGVDAVLKQKQKIVAEMDRLVVFYDGLSHGTGLAIRLAREAGKPVVIHGDKPAPRAPGVPEWRALPYPEAVAALDRAIEKWRGTPYRVGQQAPGKGVDCVRFVCGVLDDVTGRRTPIRTLPNDASMHARDSAVATMHHIRKLYLPNDVVTDGTIEPGDLIVTAPIGKSGGPGHAIIAGTKPWHLWESTLEGVRRIGLSGVTTEHYRIAAVYRIANKDTWR
ncbi:MAG: hypothetical protein LC123_02395 [Burkholderiales bacterium]|nr:hypothetical protein [Burkholderiales bacterium]